MCIQMHRKNIFHRYRRFSSFIQRNSLTYTDKFSGNTCLFSPCFSSLISMGFAVAREFIYLCHTYLARSTCSPSSAKTKANEKNSKVCKRHSDAIFTIISLIKFLLPFYSFTHRQSPQNLFSHS